MLFPETHIFSHLLERYLISQMATTTMLYHVKQLRQVATLTALNILLLIISNQMEYW